MMSKSAVAFKFKWEVLKKVDDSLLTDELKKSLWENFLKMLHSDSRITAYQTNTWKYPSDLINNI